MESFAIFKQLKDAVTGSSQQINYADYEKSLGEHGIKNEAKIIMKPLSPLVV